MRDCSVKCGGVVQEKMAPSFLSQALTWVLANPQTFTFWIGLLTGSRSLKQHLRECHMQKLWARGLLPYSLARHSLGFWISVVSSDMSKRPHPGGFRL
jgi:hypothetical protein